MNGDSNARSRHELRDFDAEMKILPQGYKNKDNCIVYTKMKGQQQDFSIVFSFRTLCVPKVTRYGQNLRRLLLTA